MVEYEGKIYISHYDTFDIENKDDFLNALKEDKVNKVSLPDTERYFEEYTNFAEVVSAQLQQVVDDIHDIGLTKNEKWNFYLSDYELAYIGIDQKTIDKQLEEEHRLNVCANMKKYDVSYSKNGVFQSIIVEAVSSDIVTNYIANDKGATVLGVSEVSQYEIMEAANKGKPIVRVSNEVDVYYDGNEVSVVDKFNSSIKLVAIPIVLCEGDLISAIAKANPRYAPYINQHHKELCDKYIYIWDMVSRETRQIELDRLSAAMSMGGFGEDEANARAEQKIQKLKDELDICE